MEVRSPEWFLSGWTQGISRAVVLLEPQGEDPFPHFFQLLEDAGIPWLLAPSSIFKSFSDSWLFHLLLFFKDFCDSIETTYHNPGEPLNLEIINYICKAPFAM